MAFSGFYYKINAREDRLRFIIVVGYQKTKNTHQGFLQINCIRENGEIISSEHLKYNAIDYIDGLLYLGKNSFSHSFIDCDEEILKLSLTFNAKIGYPKKKLGKNVMGLYGHVPFVECKHHVHAIEALANGHIIMENVKYNLNAEKTYIESTYGRNFPDYFFWAHFNQFQGHQNTHLLFSIANPRWLFLKKKVHIGYLLHKGEFYSLGSNQEFKLIHHSKKDNVIQFHFKKKNLTIRTAYSLGETAINLVGPTSHGLNRRVKEYTNASIDLSIYKNNNCIEKIRGELGTMENEEVITLIK
jgi:hypothetical protein